jgi:transcriptional regulator with XRE-family HTH domain
MMKISSLPSLTKPAGFGYRIFQVRFPFSQKQFADELGICENTLAQYEREEKPPNVEFLSRLYEVYKIHPSWLLTGESAEVSNY